VAMDIKKYYNRLGEEYLNTYSSEGMKIISQNEIEFVLSNIPMKRNKINVLEIGVGPGRISQEVIKRNINFT
jgi:16S rRNA A1518/A1519 N6-dimethyltransferase RsmA/KsgA/DIM1 with predicted DNA glycosylase/AP lyase activity